MRMKILTQAFLGVIGVSPWFAYAFNSGSTGADGAFNPTVSQEIVLPASGVFNFTNVNIPAGVTITFKKNAANTPVIILATGDIAIAGTLSLNGTSATAAGANGSLGDDGLPGIGGPGGFDGGAGGKTSAVGTARVSGAGLGPGAGGTASWGRGGGGGYGAAGAGTGHQYCGPAAGGATYGSPLVLPLIGGSGGAGGSAGDVFGGSGGGGGGGAILLAASGAVNIAGTVRADGGKGGDSAGSGCGFVGGGGSGGAIRIVATTVTGNGAISAQGGAAGGGSCEAYGAYCPTWSSIGGVGRIRIEAENITRTAASAPAAAVDLPGQLFVASLPTLTITSVAGVAAPADPTGNADITLPMSTANPVTVEFRTTGVPVGNIVKLTVTPAYGSPVTALTPALVGTSESATASTQITLPTGPSTLQAQTTYTIVASLGDALSRYANNERVEKVHLSSVMGGKSTVTLITASGKEFQVPAALLAMLPS